MAEKRKVIRKIRESGIGDSTISKEIGLSKDCIKARCRWHGLGGVAASSVAEADKSTCRNCGRETFLCDFQAPKHYSPELL